MDAHFRVELLDIVQSKINREFIGAISDHWLSFHKVAFLNLVLTGNGPAEIAFKVSTVKIATHVNDTALK
ncbi:hypothetical protein [Vibrio ouci]|uniref:hypothetical protein n=1 Tax=Vibrio ouci TaxID=2499078 RepID=UPI00142DB0B6|nr:hypothetical protein [Vibrio ouci]